MKKVLSLVLAAVLAASLSACGGALVDLDTPKSEISIHALREEGDVR